MLFERFEELLQFVPFSLNSWKLVTPLFKKEKQSNHDDYKNKRDNNYAQAK